MAAAVEGPRDLAFVLTELDGTLSRDAVTVASGSGKLEPGTLLAKVTASGKYAPSPATGSDGTQTAIAVLAYGVDATSADVDAVIVANDAEVKAPMLIFHSSVDDGTKRAAKLTQLRAVNIKAR
jgi:hypothetical protein